MGGGLPLIRSFRAVALVTALAVSAGTVRADQGGFELEIITPHNEQIQQEFEQAFSAHLGRSVRIRWLKQGTGQLLKVLEAKDRAAPGGSFELDVFFGGGVPDHQFAAQRGYLEKPDIPAEVLAGIPPQIAGVANYDPQGYWYGSALSAFGVLMNRRGLVTQNLPEIGTWEDLAHPRMFSWVVLADPRKSASVRVTYELVLQQYGWEKGWPLLMQMAANARLIADTSAAVPNEIATGNVLAGPCVDFYAHARVAMAGGEVLAYVNPAGGSAITPDPISLLRKAPHRELAEKFIAFVLSPAGQRLWILPPGTPGGPKQHALHRLPVRADIFAQLPAELAALNPYEQAGRGIFRKMDDELQNARSPLLAALFGAALVDLHSDVKAAWKALIDSGMKPAALEEWNRLPFSEQQGLELAKRLEMGGREERALTREWTSWFRQKYERVRALAR
jgi:iron(III) transport system substrate-binding protein